MAAIAANRGTASLTEPTNRVNLGVMELIKSSKVSNAQNQISPKTSRNLYHSMQSPNANAQAALNQFGIRIKSSGDIAATNPVKERRRATGRRTPSIRLMPCTSDLHIGLAHRKSSQSDITSSRSEDIDYKDPGSGLKSTLRSCVSNAKSKHFWLKKIAQKNIGKSVF